MNAAALLNMAKAEGVALVLIGDRLIWEADHQPPADLLSTIKAHRQEIIETLNAANDPPPESHVWLARVAALLCCSADFLLAHGFIDRHDLAEQYRTHPRFAARLIRSHPAWVVPAPDQMSNLPNDLG